MCLKKKAEGGRAEGDEENAEERPGRLEQVVAISRRRQLLNGMSYLYVVQKRD